VLIENEEVTRLYVISTLCLKPELVAKVLWGWHMEGNEQIGGHWQAVVETTLNSGADLRALHKQYVYMGWFVMLICKMIYLSLRRTNYEYFYRLWATWALLHAVT